ncbi:LURP-one-related 11 protein [Nymphaea thermarum]|nr:LURP-one-related 11 protein [Nymphaea thermarum]
MNAANSVSSTPCTSPGEASPLVPKSRRRRSRPGDDVASIAAAVNATRFPQFCSTSPSSLTIWRRSLIFHGKGYTVYDSTGSVLFRVDNYASDRPRETHLMDLSGNVLLTIKPSRKLGILKRWEAFKGDGDREDGSVEKAKPLFTATKGLVGDSRNKITVSGTQMDYLIACTPGQGCYKIYHRNSLTNPLAEVNQKCVNEPKITLGKDVLSLCIQPGIDQVIVFSHGIRAKEREDSKVQAIPFVSRRLVCCNYSSSSAMLPIYLKKSRMIHSEIRSLAQQVNPLLPLFQQTPTSTNSSILFFFFAAPQNLAQRV